MSSVRGPGSINAIEGTFTKLHIATKHSSPWHLFMHQGQTRDETSLFWMCCVDLKLDIHHKYKCHNHRGAMDNWIVMCCSGFPSKAAFSYYLLQYRYRIATVSCICVSPWLFGSHKLTTIFNYYIHHEKLPRPPFCCKEQRDHHPIKPWSHPPNASSNVSPNVPPLKGLSCNPMPHALRRQTPWRAGPVPKSTPTHKDAKWIFPSWCVRSLSPWKVTIDVAACDFFHFTHPNYWSLAAVGSWGGEHVLLVCRF